MWLPRVTTFVSFTLSLKPYDPMSHGTCLRQWPPPRRSLRVDNSAMFRNDQKTGTGQPKTCAWSRRSKTVQRATTPPVMATIAAPASVERTEGSQLPVIKAVMAQVLGFSAAELRTFGEIHLQLQPTVKQDRNIITIQMWRVSYHVIFRHDNVCTVYCNRLTVSQP